MTQDEKYMQLALRLAEHAIGAVEPNPAVGCVIVKEGRIIGKGLHERFGAPHAEINAIADCKTKTADPTGSTMYVTLEPCCHVGKTGPCTDAIIQAGVAKVVIAAPDPSEHVNGKGIGQLKSAGIDVEVGLCRRQVTVLNAPFFKFAKTRRPWVILKWAQSRDGYVARTTDKWISNESSRKDVHKLRRRAQAIMVGINTVIADDPLLTARPDQGKNLLRIVLDSSLKIPLRAKLLKTTPSCTLIVTTEKTAVANSDKLRLITDKGAEVLIVRQADGRCDIAEVLEELGLRNIQQLLVEGGPCVITSFITAHLADAVRVYISPETLGKEGTVSITEPMAKLANLDSLHHSTTEDFDGDTCISGFTAPVP